MSDVILTYETFFYTSPLADSSLRLLYGVTSGCNTGVNTDQPAYTHL